MKRLTKKDLMNAINQPMCFGSRLVGKKMFAQIIKELCEYKDIEEELGVDLITLFKAMAQGIYWKEREDKQDEIEIGDGYLKIHFNNGYMRDGWATVYFTDYGKTWALTKKELL